MAQADSEIQNGQFCCRWKITVCWLQYYSIVYYDLISFIMIYIYIHSVVYYCSYHLSCCSSRDYRIQVSLDFVFPPDDDPNITMAVGWHQPVIDRT